MKEPSEVAPRRGWQRIEVMNVSRGTVIVRHFMNGLPNEALLAKGGTAMSTTAPMVAPPGPFWLSVQRVVSCRLIRGTVMATALSMWQRG